MDIDNTEGVKTGVHIQLKNKYTRIYFIESYLSNIYSGMDQMWQTYKWTKHLFHNNCWKGSQRMTFLHHLPTLQLITVMALCLHMV